MDTDVGYAHAEALRLLLDVLPYAVYLGKVTETDSELRYPYLVVWPPPPLRTGQNLTGTLLSATTRTQVSAIGQDVRETLTALDRVDARLQANRPVVLGRSCGLFSQVAVSGSPAPNPSVRTPDGQPTHLAWAIYALTSIPASI